MTIIDYIILLSSVFVGSIIAFYIKNISQNNTKLLISFSGAYLFSITVLHLIPETFAGEHNHTIGLFILIGFFLQIILEQFSKGVEHGHGHIHGSVPMSMLIGLGVHSFIEGMPLGNPHHHSHMHSSLLSAIALDKIPVGIVLSHMLIESKMSKPKIILLISLFAITTPLGTFLVNTSVIFLIIIER